MKRKFGIDTIQFVWWWRLPHFKWWKFPQPPSGYYKFSTKPIFWGLYLGIVEIRFFPIREEHG